MTIHAPLTTPTAAAAHNRRRAFRAKIAHLHAALHTPPLTNPSSPPSGAIPADSLPCMVPGSSNNSIDPLDARCPYPPVHSLSPTILNIQKLCAAHYGITVRELLSHCRDLRLSHPRHVAVYLCRTLSPLSSYPFIGKRFGGRDHTTILHSYRKIRDLIQRDPTLADEIAFLLEHFTDFDQDRRPTSVPTDVFGRSHDGPR